MHGFMIFLLIVAVIATAIIIAEIARSRQQIKQQAERDAAALRQSAKNETDRVSAYSRRVVDKDIEKARNLL